MDCKRCGAKIFEGSNVCLTCGYSEIKEQEQRQKELDNVSISKNIKINYYYRKIFGDTDKRIVKRFFKYCIILLLLISLFFHFFLYVDIANKCFVTIRPALIEFSNTTIKKGIRYLRSDYHNEYVKFCSVVSSIDPNISCGGFGGGCYSEYNSNSGVIDISTPYGNWKAAAKVIIHETCHAVQFKEKRPFSEVECHEKDSVIPW